MSLYLLADKLPDLTLLSDVKTNGILTNVQDLQDWLSATSNELQAVGSVLNKDIKLSIVSETIELTADELNSAESDSFSYPSAVMLQDTDGCDHTWARFEFITSVARAVGTVVPPTVVQSHPTFDHGRSLVDLLFLTDAGESYVYSAGDSYTLTFKVTVDDTWLGIDVAPIVVTFNVV